MKRTAHHLTSQLRIVSLTLLALLSVGVVAHAQTPPETGDAPHARRENGMRSRNLFRILNLTPEQQAEIRRIRQERAGEGRALIRRLRLAQRALEEAIYSDAANESVIEARLREATEAQAALSRHLALTEFRIGRALRPEQLQTLRELRQRFPNRPERMRGGGMRGEGRPRRSLRPREMPPQN